MNNESKYFVQKMDGVLLLSFIASEAEVINVKKDFGRGKPFNPAINIDGRINYFGYIWSDVHKQAEFIIRKIKKNPKFLANVGEIWKKRVKKLKDFERKISKINFKNISDQEIVIIFKQLINLYQEEYSPALLCDPFGLHTEQVVVTNLSRIVEKRNEPRKFAEYLEILTAPREKSFVNKEEISLLELTKEIEENKNLVRIFKKGIKEARKELEKYPCLKKILEKHQEKYFWIENSYAQGIKLKENYFLKKIQRYLKEEINLEKKINQLKNLSQNYRKRKKSLIKKLNLDKEFRKLLEWIEVFGYLHDRRKMLMMEAHYYISLVLKEISRRIKLNLREMYYIDYHKIGQMLLQKKIDKNLIKERMKCCAYLIWPNKYEIVIGKKAKWWYKELLGEARETIGEIKGVSASSGVVIGRVKIIKDIKDGHKMKKGNILVTGMTRPHYMPFIKKAAAIVTDEGGITCHAAIVARELNIPCIINTKIATKVLKDGYLIEVNTNHNRVKILKK